MKNFTFNFLILLSLISLFSCNTSNRDFTLLPKCFETEKINNGEVYSRDDLSYTIELPKNWVALNIGNFILIGNSLFSDTSAGLQEYNMIMIHEYEMENGWSFDKESDKWIDRIKEGKTDENKRILGEGKTKVGGYNAKILLLENQESDEPLANDIVLNFFVEIRIKAFLQLLHKIL